MNSEEDLVDKRAFAERLRRCVALAGNGNELARRAGMPRRTLENYLSGDHEPRLGRIVQIARATGVSVNWLVTGDGPMMASETQGPTAPMPPVSAQQPTTDGRLLGRLFEAIQRVHREEGSHLPMSALAEIAAAKHDQIVAAEEDPEERLRMVKLIAVQVREELRAAAAAPHEGKQRA
jgi:DNA-binding phage protein